MPLPFTSLRVLARSLAAIAAVVVFTALGLAPAPAAGAESPLALDSLAAFKPVTANWQLASGLAGDPRRDKSLAASPGTGVLVCNPGTTPATRGHLFTTAEHGDLELDLEFLLAPGSNSGVYLQSRYEVQLFDSWGQKNPTPADCGGIYQRWDAARGAGKEGYEGTAPRANACRAPGLWQTLHIEFQAPRFDAAGKKTQNARFAKVVLNGFLIHDNVEVTGPTRASAANDEKPLGALMIQGDHGPVAIRRLAWKKSDADAPAAAAPAADAGARKNAKAATRAANRPGPKQILLAPPSDRVRMQRGFVPFEPRKRLYATSVGTPAGVHFAYDLEAGSLLRVWRGAWLDTGEMWEGRGEPQLAKPAGPALTLNAKPTVAFIEFPRATGWPETPDAMQSSQGYVLEADGLPVFLSTLSGLAIRDRIAPTADGNALARRLDFKGTLPSWDAEVLLAEADAITPQPSGGWVIGDRDYYLDWPAGSAHQPAVRKVGERELLIVRLTRATLEAPLSYSLVW